MTPPLFWLIPNQWSRENKTLRLWGDEAHHAVKVMRLKRGEVIYLADGLGKRITGEILETSAKPELVVQVQAEELTASLPPHLVLVQALTKGDRAQMAVEATSELGGREFFAWQAERCVSVWNSESKRRRGKEKWQQIAQVAAKQSRQAYHPHVHGLRTTAELAQELAAFVQDGAVVYLLEVGAEASLPSLLALQTQVPKKVVLVVGPEGGITDAEIKAFKDAGAVLAGLGPHVLRSGSAGPIAAAVVSAVCGKWEPETP